MNVQHYQQRLLDREKILSERTERAVDSTGHEAVLHEEEEVAVLY
jgi:hypothetical protein